MQRKTKIVMLLLGIVGATYVALSNQEPKAAKRIIGILKPYSNEFGLTVKESETLRKNFSNAPKKELERELRKSFLQVSLAEASDNTNLALAKLAQGMNSQDEAIKGFANSFVESILVDVAHGTVQVHPSNVAKINLLFSIYKTRAERQIAKMRTAFPKSPTLNYLQNI